MAGLVPEYEAREAAVYCNYKPKEFYELDWWEKASCVAQYRLHRIVEMHAQDAVNEVQEKEMRRLRGRR